jgi:hypothetical protein
MRTTSLKVLIGILFVLLSSTLGIRPASAQTQISVGQCVGTDASIFENDLTLGLSNSPLTVQGIVSGCVAAPNITSPTPVIFTWTTETYNVGCLALSPSWDAGNGTVTWTDGAKSIIKLNTSLTGVGILGITPTVFFFTITDGRDVGGTYVVTAALIPTINAATSCILGQPLHILSGVNAPTYIQL